MAIRIWRGDAQAIPEVVEITVDEVESGDKFTISINRKEITVTANENETLTDLSQESLASDVYNAFKTAIGCYSNAIPEFAEICASTEVDSDTNFATKLILTGPTDGKPICGLTCSTTNSTGGLGVEVTTLQDGDPGKNEQQQITILGNVNGGTFTLTFDGQTTGAIAYNASAATVQTALEALSNIDAGDVTVTGSAGGPWTVDFGGQYANADVPLMTGDGSSLTKPAGSYSVGVKTIVNGDPGKNEKQEVSVIGATGGTFTLSFRGATTGAIAYNASASTVQTALEALSTINVGDVSVFKPRESVWQVEFKGQYANQNVDQLTGDGSSLVGMVKLYVSEETKGSAGTNEIQSFTIRWTPGLANNAFRIRRTDTNQLSAWLDPDSLFAGIFSARNYGSYESKIAYQFESAVRLGYGAGNVKVTVKSAREGTSTTRNSVNFHVEWVKDWAAKDAPSHSLSFHGDVSGTVSTIQNASAKCTNEVQRVILSPKPTGGTFTLGFRGQNTSSLNYNATATDIKTALEALSTIDTVTVTDKSTSTQSKWDVEFTGAEGCQDLDDMLGGVASSLTGGVVGVNTIQDATDPTNEVQRVTLFGSPSGGTFTLTFDGNTTANIAWDADNAAVESALEALANISDVRVDSDNPGGPWTVEFLNPGGQNVKQMTGDPSGLTGAQISVSTIQESEAPKNEVQRVRLLGSPTGGTFTLTFNANTTTSISYDAEPAEVQSALEGLAGIGIGDVQVTGTGGGPWVVEFIGSLAGANQNQMTGSSSLTSSGTQTITCTQKTAPTGPNWWSEPDNWQTPGSTTPTLPQAGDVVVFEASDVSCLYGLESNNVALSELHIKASYTGDIGLPKHNGLYYECRPTALKVTATNVYVGEGEGSGSSRVRLDLQAIQTTVEVFSTGAAADDLPAFIWKGTHASNVCRVYKGSVGIAMETHGDDSKLSLLEVGFVDSEESDAQVWVGAGVSQLTTVNQIGGQVVVDTNSALTTSDYTKEGGTLEWKGEGAITTLKELEGRTDYLSTGTITNLTVGDEGAVYFTKDLRSRTVTNCTLEAGSTLIDSNRTVTFTNGIVLSNTNLSEITLDVGTHVKLTVAGGP